MRHGGNPLVKEEMICIFECLEFYRHVGYGSGRLINFILVTETKPESSLTCTWFGLKQVKLHLSNYNGYVEKEIRIIHILTAHMMILKIKLFLRCL